MSKIKSPHEKKRISLERDRRNIYGENPSSSRKGTRRGKQRSHMEQRRSVAEALRQVRGSSEQAEAGAPDSEVKIRTIRLRRYAFKKSPDAPLGAVIKRKLSRRQQSQQKGNDTV